MLCHGTPRGSRKRCRFLRQPERYQVEDRRYEAFPVHLPAGIYGACIRALVVCRSSLRFRRGPLQEGPAGSRERGAQQCALQQRQRRPGRKRGEPLAHQLGFQGPQQPRLARRRHHARIQPPGKHRERQQDPPEHLRPANRLHRLLQRAHHERLLDFHPVHATTALVRRRYGAVRIRAHGL